MIYSADKNAQMIDAHNARLTAIEQNLEQFHEQHNELIELLNKLLEMCKK